MEESTRPLKVKDDEQFKQLVADPERLVVLVLVAPWYVVACRGVAVHEIEP